MITFLVEHYEPGAALSALRGAAARVRRSAEELGREGRPVRYLRSAFVPADEGFLSTFEAASEDAVREVYARAGVLPARIAVAHLEDAAPQRRIRV